MSGGDIEFSLADRATMFQKILIACKMTHADGAALPLESGVDVAMDMLVRTRESDNCVYVVGNGGSASVASHMVIDLIHVAKMRAFALHDSSVITCMANDYGYENAFARILSSVARPGDLLIAISSSGQSQNIRNAVQQMKKLGGEAITLSGFDKNNPLRAMGDINMWLDSDDYGFVEVGHQFVLHNLIDRFSVPVL